MSQQIVNTKNMFGKPQNMPYYLMRKFKQLCWWDLNKVMCPLFRCQQYHSSLKWDAWQLNSGHLSVCCFDVPAIQLSIIQIQPVHLFQRKIYENIIRKIMKEKTVVQTII